MAVERLWLSINPTVRQQRAELLERVGLVDDTQVDYAVGIFEDGKLIATAAVFQNIIKTVAVNPDYRSQDYLGQMMTNLLSYLDDQNEAHSFVYTKPSQMQYFQAFGFQIVSHTDSVSLMERGLPNLAQYQQQLRRERIDATPASAIVMNANPFTLGHQYLVEQTAKMSGAVYVFVVTEDRSFFTTEERIAMVQAGVAHLHNVVVIPTEQYMVSSATFPSYFLKDQADLAIASVQAQLDATLFKTAIAPQLNIKQRFVGDEPLSPVTAIYNQALVATLAPDVNVTIVPRRAINAVPISATAVRAAYQAEDWQLLQQLVPTTTLDYLKGR